MSDVRRIDALLERLETPSALDDVAVAVTRVVDRRLPRGRVRDVLRGEPIGHPLHPALILVPVGAFSSAAVLDLVPGQGAAVRILVLTGLASSVPAALAGITDWNELGVEQKRVGVAHAGINLTGLACYLASLAAAARGHGAKAKVLRFVGLGVIGGGGYLGGHLTYRLGARVDTAFSP